MINFTGVAGEIKQEDNPHFRRIPNHPYRILLLADTLVEKVNALLNLINHQSDIDKICLYSKDSYQPKFRLLINKRKEVGLILFNDPTSSIEYSNDII